MIGAIAVGIAAGMGTAESVDAFAKGFGDTMGGVGILIGLGAMYGKLLADSGGADRIVDTLVNRASPRALPWTMALVGALIGLPMFFEVGLVLLMPVIILVARRSGLSLMRIAIPTLAGLSAMHGLVPPHPGPLVAIGALGANLGLTLALGVIVAIPTVIISGPVFSKFAARWAPVPVPDLFVTAEDEGEDVTATPRPTFVAALFSILLPVALMLASALSDIVGPGSDSALRVDRPLPRPARHGPAHRGDRGHLHPRPWRQDEPRGHRGHPGDLAAADRRHHLHRRRGRRLQAGADRHRDRPGHRRRGGGLGLSVLFLAWVVAVLIRVATGSATVATVTAAGILAPVAADLTSPHVALMVWPSAPARCSSRTSTTPGSGWSRATWAPASGRRSRPGQ